MLRIRFSRIATMLKCEKKHKYQWIDGLERNYQDDRILKGVWGHTALKVLLRGGTEVDAYSEAYTDACQHYGTEKLSDEALDALALSLEVSVIAAKRFLARFEPIMVEEGLEYELGAPYNAYLTGTPDVIAKDKETGAIWLIDHKFRETFRQPESELLNLQMTLYSKLLQLTKGITVVGSRQFQIRPIIPKVPEVTAKGTLSKRNITTDWPTYKQAILDAGFKVSDYEDMRLKLESKTFFDFDSTIAKRSQQELDYVWEEEILPTCAEIVEAEKNQGKGAVRCYDFGSCNFCDMKSICLAELKNENPEYVLKSQYRKRGEQPRLVVLVDE